MDLARRTLLVVVAATLSLAACGSSDGDADSDARQSEQASTTTEAADGESEPEPVDGFVTGTPEEWLAVVCGDGAEVTPGSGNFKSRYGLNATSLHYCNPPSQPDNTATYPEAVLFDADPSADWQPPTEPDQFKTWAIGQVSADEWAVVYEDTFTREIAEPHLAGLTEFGFDVYENNEPVS